MVPFAKRERVLCNTDLERVTVLQKKPFTIRDSLGFFKWPERYHNIYICVCVRVYIYTRFFLKKVEKPGFLGADFSQQREPSVAETPSKTLQSSKAW
jgi:hypothetical protein